MKITDEQLLNDLKRVGSLNENKYVSRMHYAEHGKYNEKTVATRFGGWANALRAADLAVRKDDILGDKFGMLTVVAPTSELYHGNYVWECKCDCGNIARATGAALKSGKAASCGCRSNLGESMKYPEKFGNAVKKGIERQTHASGVRYMDFTDNVRKDNVTGYRGVSAYETKAGTRYVAELNIKKRRYRKAGFKTAEEAYRCRLELERKHFPKDFIEELERRKKNEKD